MSEVTPDYKKLPTFEKDFHDENKIRKMVYKSLGITGIQVSCLGFGGSELALCHGTSKEINAIETVIKAVKSGINYIDTAPYYGFGNAELVLGKALKEIPRSTYYLATKVGRYGPEIQKLFDFSASRTIKSVDESLQRLGLDSVDVLLAHDIEFAHDINIIINETLPALQKMKECGKTKFIGITGYPVEKLKEVLKKSSVKIDVVLSYCRYTLFDDTLKTYIPYFKEKGVGLINAAGLGMGLLTKNGPPDWHPASEEIKKVCKSAEEYCSVRNVNIAKLAANHCFSQSDIDIHLIGMEKEDLLEVNLNTLLNSLTPEEITVREEIIQKYFSKLPTNHWENEEVAKYREDIKKAILT